MANLKSVLKCWSEFNLPSLQKSLDQTATDTAQRQDEAEKAKKLLIELTKEWRRNNDEDVRNKVAPVIKAFQKEVDSLNKRSKSAENSFLLLYKNLLEIPDPVPALKQAETIKKQLEKAKDFELENQNLRKTLEEYHSEFAEVKNQEVTLNKLKEKIKEYEEEQQQKLKNKLEEKDKELKVKYDEREQKLIDSKLQLATKLGDTEAKVKSLTEALKQLESEVFDLKAKHEEELIARTSEIELLESDLERANQNFLAAEKFAESLKTQYQQDFLSQTNDDYSKNLSEEANSETIRLLEYQLLSKEREASQLMQEVHHQQVVASKTKDTADKEISSLENILEQKNKQIATLENQIESQGDYDEIKRELGVLKMIEFSGVEHEHQSPNVKPLEKLLVEKNKSLQSECTMLKVQHSEQTGKYEELQRNLTEAYRTMTDQKELIIQLESDLMNVRGYTSAYRGEGVGAPAPPTVNTEFLTKAVQNFNVDEVDELDKQNADSLLPIIASQRERFRTKNLELESQTRHQQRQITMLQDEVDTVRQDNVKLYEKIKFLQSYPNKKNTSSITVEDESLKRYSSQYEERIDPFSLFSKKEKQQRYSNLSAPEKVTLSMGRFILSNKIARTLVFFYTIMLHCLVFLVLYKFAYTEPCKRVVGVAADQMFGYNAAHNAINPPKLATS